MCLNESVQNIFPNNVDPLLDPIDSPTSMVFTMAQREIATRAPQRAYGPLPQQSAFVATAGTAIPQPVITTEMLIGSQSRANTIAQRE